MGRIMAVILFLLTQRAEAGTLSLFGYGAHNQAMENSTSALPTDAYSQAYDPALMAYQGNALISGSIEGAITSFEKINQVIADTPNLGGSSFLVSDINTKTPDTFVAVVALQAPLSHGENPIHFGVHVSAPVQDLLMVDTQDAYQPQYVMYLVDTQKFAAGFGFAKILNEHFAVGLGANSYLIQAVTSRVRLPAGGNSTARLKMDVKPGLAPTAGLVWNLDQKADKESGEAHWKAALTYWGKQDFRSQYDFDNTISIIGPSDLIFTGKSSLYFDPETFILGASFSDEANSYSFSANWERWGAYSSSVVALSFQTFTGSFNQILPAVAFHDTLSLHSGFEHRWEHSAVRAGYAFVPTPVPDQSGDSNFLDSDKHEGALGVGFDLPSWSLLGGKWKLDLCGFVQYLTPKQVTKVSSQSVGYPGYKIGGTVYGYGATLTSEF